MLEKTIMTDAEQPNIDHIKRQIAEMNYEQLEALSAAIEQRADAIRQDLITRAAELGLELQQHGNGPGRRKKRRNGHAHHAAD